MTAVGNRAHLYVHPGLKEKLSWCLTAVLGSGPPVELANPPHAEPILAYRFPGGGSLSFEFTDAALTEAQARRGAWLEIKCENPDAVRKRIVEAGLPLVEHSATKSFYFVLPGGQILGVV
jgi:hypothetical protein